MTLRSALMFAGGAAALGLAMTVAVSADGGYGWGSHPGYHDRGHHGRQAGWHPGPGRGGFGGGPVMMFDLLDIDASGTVNLTEALRVPKQRFARLDADKDGFLSVEEFGSDARGRWADWTPRRFDRIDANNDDKIAPEEFELRARTRFDTADADNDGSVTLDEFEAVRRDMRRFGRQMRKVMRGGFAEDGAPRPADN